LFTRNSSFVTKNLIAALINWWSNILYSNQTAAANSRQAPEAIRFLAVGATSSPEWAAAIPAAPAAFQPEDKLMGHERRKSQASNLAFLLLSRF